MSALELSGPAWSALEAASAEQAGLVRMLGEPDRWSYLDVHGQATDLDIVDGEQLLESALIERDPRSGSDWLRSYRATDAGRKALEQRS